MKLTSIGSFIKRSKIPIDIHDNDQYKRVTIKIKHNGVSLRDVQVGKKIGTKKQFLLKAGQFIVSKIDARYGAFGIAPDSVDGAIITGNFWAYDVDFDQVNIEWFNQYTNSQAFYEVCERASSGITHRKYLNETTFLSYEIQLPNIEEQLAQIDDIKKHKISFRKLTSELSTQLALVKQLRQAFLSEAMQGKLCKSKPVEDSETGRQLLARIKAEKVQLIKDKKLKKEKDLPVIKPEEIPFDIPDNWIWCRLGDVVYRIFDGPFGSHLKTADYVKTGVQVIRLENLSVMNFNSQKETFISEDKYNTIKQHTVFENDIIIGSFLADGVKCTVLPKLKYTSIAKADCFTIRTKASFISNRYIMYLLSSQVMFQELFKLLRGMTRLRINTSQLKELPIPLPPLSIQNHIVTKLDQLMKTCDDLEKSIKLSQTQNEQLLQQILKEALEVKDKSAQNVKLAIPENRKNFAKQVLGGKIISLFKDDPNFTHIKLQKLQYLSEHIAEADLGSDYYFQTAGPYDNRFMHSIAISLERSKWFKKENYKYYPLEKVEQIDQYYEGYFAPVSDKLSNLFKLLANATDTFSEIIATLYAVWNNRIIKKEELNDNLLIQDFYNWSNRKQQYTKDQLVKGLEFIRINHIEPTGFGKELKRAKGK